MSDQSHHSHDQGHDHDHGHDHGHGGGGHSHAPKTFGRAFAIGATLNIAIVLIQAVFGALSHSVALLADAGHSLSDVLSLLIAWGASVAAQRAPSTHLTYGMKSASILAALFNAVFLLVIVGALSWEAALRLHNPPPVDGQTVSIVAAAALVLNGFCAWLFLGGRGEDINVRGAFAHMAADAAISAGVVLAGLAIVLTGWLWIDPVVSLAINAVIVVGTWSLLRDSVAMALNAVPSSIDPRAVRVYLSDLEGVASVHDLHIWSMSTTEIAMTAHLVAPDGHPGDAFVRSVAIELRNKFKICHATLQIERDGASCELAPDHVV